jgi:hypothetical protein
MTRNRRPISLMAVCGIVAVALIAPDQAQAKDDFGRIVHHIESRYHVHRQHRWVMGLAGFTVKFWHFAGIKNFKCAIYEHQQFANSGSDTRFDEIVRGAMDSGWQPIVQSYDRRSGERTYIYAQDLGKEMKVLLVNLDQSNAVVLQVKVNPEKLAAFVNEASAGHGHSNQSSPRDEIRPSSDDNAELVASSAANWDGICLHMD